MILPDFKDFVAQLPPKGRILGIDWGAKRVGIAISDESHEFIWTRPVIVTSNQKPVTSDIINLITFERVAAIIIGLPVRGDGTESDTSKMVREFAAKLANGTDLPISFIPENLTSFAAAENLGGGRKNKNALDSESAKIILENAIAMMQRV